MKQYDYYFKNGTCRTIKGVKDIVVQTFIHLHTDEGMWIINPREVNCCFVKEVEDERSIQRDV